MNTEIKVANKTTDRCISGIYFNRYIKGRKLTSLLSQPLSQFMQDIVRTCL